MTPANLTVQLECELPSELAVGGGTALFVCGWCFSAQAPVRSLSIAVDGERQPVMAHGMPRLDPFQALGSPNSYRSGFWGIARVTPRRPGAELELALHAVLEDGGEAVADLATLTVLGTPEPVRAAWPAPDSGPAVAICMTTHNPPADLLARQLDSIRSQTHRNWVCLISDDCSVPEAYAAIEAAVVGDRRFLVSRSPRRLGFYRNFERVLAMAPPDARYVAMADQDDAWHSDKLATLLGAIGGARLVYSDASVVARDGEVISDTWWSQRRNNHSSLLSLLVANAVTGAASLLRRDLLDDALPFPPAQFAHFHDHWIGLIASALGDIAFVDRPLYEYVQHGNASLGHAAANQMTSLRDRLGNRRALRERVRLWRLHYFLDACRLVQFAAVLSLRCSERMSDRKRRELDRFLDAEHSLRALARLGLRGARELIGTPETLGAEWMLMHAFAWRRLLAISARDRPQRHMRLDAQPPRPFVQPPGRTGVHVSARAVADKIAPLRWAAADDAPQRINLLIPTIDLTHFFGGYIAKLNLARRLAQRGRRVRLVTVDPVGPLPAGWKRSLESYSGLSGLFDAVEVAFGREAARIEVSRSDSFIATTWWTAHIAQDAMRTVDGERFLYLIQEYEPFTFPMGTYAALAAESYTFEHFALFSSKLLRDYFREHRVGVYATGLECGDRSSTAFENAITPVDPPAIDELAARERRRLLFYARPEPHAARNMFELGVLAVSRALEEGTFAHGWELRGIGTVEEGRRISLGGGATLELAPRRDQATYGNLLRQHDLGLALMYTPHPSLVPIEMAAAGMITVTNSFENKTAEAMRAISTNLIAAEPTVEALAAALRQAASAASDVRGRIRGSAVRWSRNWEDSFHSELLELVISVLERPGVAAV